MQQITNNDEFGQLICQWFTSNFPKEIKPTKGSLLEILSDLIYSTKENRYGPMPTPESQVVVRETIRKSIEENLPIPILVPWGGRKAKITDSCRLDFAEVSGLKQLIHLDNAVKNYFPPGLHINIRVEDINANFLYRHQNNVEEYTGKYSSDFGNLLKILAGNTNRIYTVRESQMMDKDEYFSLSRKIADFILPVLTIRSTAPYVDIQETNAFKALSQAGWKGTFPQEQIDYYLHRYSSLYPDSTLEDHIVRMADYFGGSKARYDLGAKGNPQTEVGSFIQLNFTPQVPGAPDGLFSNTVYWRTTPFSSGRTHISPWRAKGFVKISGNEVKTKIASWNDPIIQQLTPSVTTLTKDDISIEIDSDYIAE